MKWIERNVSLWPVWLSKQNDMKVCESPILALSFSILPHVEMVAAMKQVAKSPLALTCEERNLFSVSYKNVIGSRRAGWRMISSIEQKHARRASNKVEITRRYKEQIEREIMEICEELVGLLDEFLLPNETSFEGRTFYWKMYASSLISSFNLLFLPSIK